MMNYEKKMQAIILIAETLNPVPLRDLAFKINGLAAAKEQNAMEKPEIRREPYHDTYNCGHTFLNFHHKNRLISLPCPKCHEKKTGSRPPI